MARVEKPSALKVTPEEKAEVKVLVERVLQLVRDGVTGMDLLEVFLRRTFSHFKLVTIRCGCIRALMIPLESTQKMSTRIRWRSG